MSLARLLWLCMRITPKPVTAGVEFQYVGRSTLPDLIRVYVRGKLLFTYAWIDGVEAVKGSRLAAWQRMWSKTV